jgi:nitroreductase
VIVCGARVAGLDVPQVRAVLAAAAAAPSLSDSRPWRFQCTATDIELHADHDRALPERDPDGRELVLACGAALMNLRLAVHGYDLHPHVRLLPEPDHPTLLASVRPQSLRHATGWEHRLLAAIHRQPGPRDPFARTPVPDAVRTELRRAVEVEQSWLAELNSQQLTRLRELTRQDATGGAGGAKTGVGTRVETHTRARAEHPDGPMVVVVGSLHDDTRSRLRTGQAVQRILLSAAATGLDTEFIREPIAVPGLRAELRGLIGGVLWPQSALRIGYRTAV